MIEIEALQCVHCKNIIFSRHNHDLRFCGCGKVGIDDNGCRIIFDDGNDFIRLKINSDKLIELILTYDWAYGNRNVPSKYKDGYWGLFELKENSNYKLYDDLIIGEYLKF